jgi:hypothetical protein
VQRNSGGGDAARNLPALTTAAHGVTEELMSLPADDIARRAAMIERDSIRDTESYQLPLMVSRVNIGP